MLVVIIPCLAHVCSLRATETHQPVPWIESFGNGTCDPYILLDADDHPANMTPRLFAYTNGRTPRRLSE